MNVETQLAHPDRTKFLGGSDAAAVMGLSPWATPVELWQQKTGRIPKEEPTAIKRKIFARGHKLEPFIRDMVIDKLTEQGLHVDLIAVNERYNDPEYGFMSCEIDFELRLTGQTVINGDIVTFDGEHVNADAKSVTGFARKKWGEEDTEDVPIEYAAQFMFGLMVTGRGRCLVAALKSFDDVDIYWVNRDQETIDAMRPKLAAFWIDHVLGDVPPDPFTYSDIKALFPLSNGQAVEASPEIAEAVARLRDVKRQLKTLKDTEEFLQFKVAEFISPNSVLTHQGREIATWKGQADTRLDMDALRDKLPDVFAQFTKTKTIRVMRLKKGI